MTPKLQSPVVARAITTLQMLYGVLPAEIRLVMAEAVSSWAQKAREQALSQLGIPDTGPQQQQPPHNAPATFTTTGHSRA